MVRASLLFFIVALVACGESGSSGTRGPTEPVDPPDELGSFDVGHSTFTAVDESRRGRSLLVDIWYPVDAEDADPKTNSIF